MAGSVQNIFKIPELKRRLLITLALLAVYRIGVFVPTPGVDAAALTELFAGAQNALFGLYNMFTGGALEQFSVFSLGIMPYISASIILQLLTAVVPHLERLKKEGEEGRKKITQYTRYGTVLLSIIQGFGIAMLLESQRGVVTNPGWEFRLLTVITLTAGTAFIMWLGEQITERGVGNGISLIIFAGIVARFPSAIAQTYEMTQVGQLSFFFVIALVLFMLLVIAIINFFEQGQRRIPIQYAKRVVGRKMYGGQSSYLPLKINMAGVIPPIFAMALLGLPSTIIPAFQNVEWLQVLGMKMQHGQLAFEITLVALIIFFCYFYTAITFNPTDVADNMRKQGGFIPGIRPGSKTAEYIDRVLSRITLWGALYISAICVLPDILMAHFGVPFYFGGTSLLIVVGVAIDTVSQIESHMMSRHYEGFMKKGTAARVRGR